MTQPSCNTGTIFRDIIQNYYISMLPASHIPAGVLHGHLVFKHMRLTSQEHIATVGHKQCAFTCNGCHGVFFENETLSPLKLFTLSNELAPRASSCTSTALLHIYTVGFRAAAFFVHFHGSLRRLSRFSATISANSSTELYFGYPVIANLQCHNLITREEDGSARRRRQ